ncbi:ABC transporter related protein [Caldibacillus thermoamylovorans]|uniref:ABC transporter related protein n=1 Tax=Caldibacillus thermoamylovorans TaxID=35841 RepID=A0A090J4Y8_9BACI|nr:ATP-binding cassette domain-containing protein [Caldibacillus thermoamylovorans]CEE02965.1 ABC transporter related protein [Caldibacillus thermoamylovorans]
MDNVVIETNALTKAYKNTIAINNISLSVTRGTVVGLLGKNGAGKTTLNKLITGLIFPTHGSIKVFDTIPKGGEKRLGFLSENIALYPNLTARENLEIVFLQEGVLPKREQISQILKTVSIKDTKKKVRDFSLGMKRRLQIAMTVLANERELFIFDEPTNGLDVDGVFWLKELINNLKYQGKTILLSSHSILELEDILTDYLIFNKGRISDKGRLDKINGKVLHIEILANDIDRARAFLEKNGFLFRVDGSTMSITIQDNYKSLLKVLYEEGIFPISYYINKKSLVDKFHQFAGDNNDDK